MKVIFLDIDGVLNSIDSMVAYHYLKIPQRSRELDLISIGLLKALCDKTEAKICISSTWRIGRTVQDFIDIFQSYGWEDSPIIGMTPIMRSHGIYRGHEIQHWLDEHPEVENYVILDDDSDMLEPQFGNFVSISSVNGFRSKHYCKCLRLFGYPNEGLENQVNFVRKSDISV